MVENDSNILLGEGSRLLIDFWSIPTAVTTLVKTTIYMKQKHNERINSIAIGSDPRTSCHQNRQRRIWQHSVSDSCKSQQMCSQSMGSIAKFKYQTCNHRNILSWASHNPMKA